MSNFTLYPKEYSVYPGEYVPLHEKEMLMEESIRLSKTDQETMPFHMHEYSDYYKVELSLPGVRREDLIVHIQGQSLSVAVLPLHDNGPVKQEFAIPGLVEGEFVTATFLLGILCVFLPKAKEPSEKQAYPVIIY